MLQTPQTLEGEFIHNFKGDQLS